MTVRTTDKDFISVWNQHRSASAVAQALGADLRGVNRRRRTIEKKHGVLLRSDMPQSADYKISEYSKRADVQLDDGVIIVGSDAHYWPGVISTAHQAFVRVIKDLKPALIVLNGDLFDGAAVSRYPRSDWSKMPSVKEELEAVSDRVAEIRDVAGNAKIWWCMGNHDMRFESRLAGSVSEFEGVRGFALQDHFPETKMVMSIFVNQTLMIKHRYHNGVHATFNNTLKSGVSMCTGHLHRLQATIFSDYRGARWGIDCGTLADTDGAHMHYGEDNPMNHCSGFAVLTIKNGQLLHPEFCSVLDDRAYFRGQEVILSDKK